MNRLFKSATFLLLLLFLSNCDSTQNTETEAKPSTEPVATNKDGTAELVKLLQESTARFDASKVSYVANSIRAEWSRNLATQSTDINQKLNLTFQYSYELLNAGKIEPAIVELEKLLATLKSANVDKNILYSIKRMLALSYVRLGEQNNCLNRYNPNRCIMPFAGNGVYEIKESVRSAVHIYEEMLKEKPDDYEAVWMLNFCYMVLGEHPDKVPPNLLLPKSAFEARGDFPRFQNIGDRLGINTVALAGGACVEDFDNDGFLDIIASSWGLNDQIQFYKNNGGLAGTTGSFSNKTKESGLTGLTGGLNINHADFNNDGFMDILVLRGAWFETEGDIPNSLIRNNGDGTFSDVTIESGLLSLHPTQTATWADFNNDGWLDLFIGNESGETTKHPCEIYFNNGDKGTGVTFSENKISESGLGNISGFIKGCTAGDVNNDGWMDLYVSIFGKENKLFLNAGPSANGISTFTDITEKAGVARPVQSFPCWFWDFDNDGFEDILVAGFGDQNRTPAAHLAALNFKGQKVGGQPHLYRNNGDGTFTEISQKSGMKDALFVMGSNYGDIDNDGFLDCYFGTGEPSFTAIVPNIMMRNNAGKTFQDVTMSGGFGHVQKGHGVGFGDFDNDGDQDIFCVLGGAFEGDVFGDAFFLNPMGNEKNWVTLKVEGTTSNRAAIGARVKIIAEKQNGQQVVFYHTVSTGSSFGSNSLQIEAGLGDAVKIIAIEVRWPNRQQQPEVFENVETRRFVLIKEGAGNAQYLERKAIEF